MKGIVHLINSAKDYGQRRLLGQSTKDSQGLSGNDIFPVYHGIIANGSRFRGIFRFITCGSSSVGELCNMGDYSARNRGILGGICENRNRVPSIDIVENKTVGASASDLWRTRGRGSGRNVLSSYQSYSSDEGEERARRHKGLRKHVKTQQKQNKTSEGVDADRAKELRGRGAGYKL